MVKSQVNKEICSSVNSLIFGISIYKGTYSSTVHQLKAENKVVCLESFGRGGINNGKGEKCEWLSSRSVGRNGDWSRGSVNNGAAKGNTRGRRRLFIAGSVRTLHHWIFFNSTWCFTRGSKGIMVLLPRWNWTGATARGAEKAEDVCPPLALHVKLMRVLGPQDRERAVLASSWYNGRGYRQ